MAPASVSKTVAVSAKNPLAPAVPLEVLKSHWKAAADSAAATSAPRIAAAATLICVYPNVLLTVTLTKSISGEATRSATLANGRGP